MVMVSEGTETETARAMAMGGTLVATAGAEVVVASRREATR